MKKFLLAFLAVVCLACLSAAAAACSGAKYYTLYFNTPSGAEVVCEIPSGYEVREGYKVVFSVEVDDNATGTPRVAVNGSTIDADSKGYYSFKMKKNTTVTVTGVYLSGGNSILFDKGDLRVTYDAEYLDDNGKVIKLDTEAEGGVSLKAGTDVAFTIDVSVYYGENPEFNVLENTEIMPLGTDGKYHVTAGTQKTISIQGLELDTSFLQLDDGGSGTAEDPYKIRKPIDLYVMASFVSNQFYYGYLNFSYFSLENDINMKGEEMFIIGTSDTYYFGGDFNGNGNTISNYYISDTAIDQEDYKEGFMPNIGLFGVAFNANIYDLNLESITYKINAATWGESFIAGGVVAYGIGVNITNCSVSGKIDVIADNNYFGYVGGIIGYQMSAYDSANNTFYNSTVRSCSTDIFIAVNSGYVLGAGGIAGFMATNNESAPVMLLNCYSTGDVAGGMRTGGIAGVVSSYCSVINCYATGYVDAYNSIGSSAAVDIEAMRYAYSGGIVGELECDSVVANCFFTGDVFATSSAGLAVMKDIAGHTAIGADGFVHSQNAIVHNCVSINDKNVTINANYIKTVLGWSEGDWKFDSDYPTVNTASGSHSFTVTVKVEGNTVATLNVADNYQPMLYWYINSENLPEFINGDNGNRTFGYYFDAELTKKVPVSFIPTNDITLYAGFANYGEVAGKYYLQWSDSGSGRYLELLQDGTLIYRDGALVSESYYYYDGDIITLRETYLAIIDGLSDSAYSSFCATVENGVMTIWDNQYYPSKTVKAVKEAGSFGYGRYYNGSVEYLFNTDGTGVYSNGTDQPFTYTITGNSIEISLNGGSTVTATFADGSITVSGTKYDAYHSFAGVWEKSAGSHKEYTFDGKGGWSYVYYGYDADGEVVDKQTATGSYTFTGNEIDLKNGTKFTIKDGVLMLGKEVYYYKQYSYAGTWNNFAKQFSIEIRLDGITSDGWGKALINYGSSFGSYNLTYEARVNGDGVPVLYMYNNDFLVASLVYNAGSRTLSGSVYQASSGKTANTTFYLYDDFRGNWISAGYEVTFNGLGNYTVAGTATTLALRGTATVNGVSGTYTLNNNTLTGKLECGGKTYNISYNEADGTITVGGADSFTLQQRDMWYNIKLTDGNGTVYSFDGKGNLGTGTGTMTVTDKNGSTTQNYTAGVTVKIEDNDYKLNGAKVYLYTPFTGTWYVSGNYDEQTLVIDYFNAANKAEGSYLGTAYTCTYYPDGNYVALTTVDSETAIPLYYVNLLDGVDVIELAVSQVNSTLDDYTVCTSGNFDKYKGEYSYDGGTLIFDGFGNSVFTDGSAKYVKNGVTVESYAYIVNELEQVLLQSDKDGMYYVFYAKDGGDYTAADGGKYAMDLPDDLYGIKAIDKDGKVYMFGGNGYAKDSDNAEYTYEITKDKDTTLMEYGLTLTGEDGETKAYVLDYSTGVYKLTLSTQNQ